MKTTGLFRLAGNQEKIQELQKQFNTGKEPDLSLEDVHTVSGLLKSYFRNLSNPLVPFELYECFVSASGEKLSRHVSFCDL